MSNKKSMIDLFGAARAAGVPLVAIRTADQTATVEELVARCGKDDEGHEFPFLQWDAARGIGFLNAAGRAALVAAKIKPDETVDFLAAMTAAQMLPPKTVLLVHNAHRQLTAGEPLAVAQPVQAVANLRDPYKKSFRMLVLLAPAFVAPPELGPDFVTLDYPLPDAAALGALVMDLHAIAKKGLPNIPALTPTAHAKAVDALAGVKSLFAAEQVTAMSYDENGLDQDTLLERARQTIEQTPGLSVYRGTETFKDLRGLESVKTRLLQHIHAKTPVGVVVWIDEGADVFSNVESDTSGVKTDQQRQLLVDMEEHGWRGIIGVGVPGSGKSALARAFGNEAGCLTIQVDFGAMESKYVGESEGRLRDGLNVIKEVGKGHAFFMLTCNSLKGIRPQFQARFRRGVFFFDLPSADERDAIWRLYLDRYQIKAGPKNPRPDDAGWVGREIKECCESAWDCGVSLAEAARFIVPVSRSRATDIEQMRSEANGRFLDASKPGPYEYSPEPMERAIRAIAIQKSKAVN